MSEHEYIDEDREDEFLESLKDQTPDVPTPEVITTGKALFLALEQHPARSESGGSEAKFSAIKESWGAVSSMRVMAPDSVSSTMLIAICCFNSAIRRTLLNGPQEEQLVQLQTAAMNKWVAMGVINLGSLNLVSDVANQPIGEDLREVSF